MLPPVELARFVGWYSEFQTRVGSLIERLLATDVGVAASLGDSLEARIQPILDHRLAGIDAALVRVREHEPITAFIGELRQAVEQLDEQVGLVDLDGKDVQVPFRRWFELEFIEPASAAVARLEGTLAATLETLRGRVVDAERTLDYYALAIQRYRVDADDSAADEFETTGARRLESLIGVIDRMSDTRAQRLRLDFIAASGSVIEAASAPYRAHRPDAIQVAIAAHARRRERGEQVSLLRRSVLLTRSLHQRAQPVFRQLREEIRDLIATEEQREHSELHELLGADPNELGDSLPLGYRRLFASTPLEISELYVQRPALEHACATAIESWNAGVPQVLLVHGDRGSGKRTLLNQVLAGVRSGARVSWVRLGPNLRETGEVAKLLARAMGSSDNPEGFTELAAATRDPIARRTVIVVENCERLLAPSTGGIARMTDFMSMVAATTPATLWILLMASPAAALALHRLGLSSRIPTVLEVGPMAGFELEAMLRARQRLSGFELEFAEPNISLLGRLTAVRPPSVSEVFHARLLESSGGNPRQALFEWLACARPHPSREGRIVMEALPDRTRELLGPRPLSQRLVLALLAQHGSLTSNEIVEALAQPRADVQGDIHVLWAAGLLAPMREQAGREQAVREHASREQDGHWGLCPTIAHPLSLELRALNMI
jgi:hypothetical protein